MLIESQRHLFDIPDDIAYLNCAYMGPLMKHVVEAGHAGIALKATPWSLFPQDFFSYPQKIREKCAELVGATASDIALVTSASYGIATAARNLPLKTGEDIICLEDQFPSNYYTWDEAAKKNDANLRVISRAEAKTGNGYADWTSAILTAIGDQTAIVTLPHCHWTDGALIDLVKVGKKVRKHGAALVVDITQSGGAMPFNVADIQPDFVVCASYKWLLGPYSTGFLYVAPKWQNGTPLEENWIARKGSEDFRGLVDYAFEYQPGAVRFDMGERANFHLLPMMGTAIDQLLEWGVDNIAETLTAKTSGIAKRAEALGMSSAPGHLRAGHFLGLGMPGGVPQDLLSRLAEEKIFVSVRGDSVRVTPHLYNTDTDVDRLMEALGGLL